MLEIKLANDEDYAQIWPVIHDVLRTGDTYPFVPEATREEAFISG